MAGKRDDGSSRPELSLEPGVQPNGMFLCRLALSGTVTTVFPTPPIPMAPVPFALRSRLPLARVHALTGCGVIISGIAALASVAAIGAVQPACAAEPYPEAVAFSQQAARAVLAQEGRETCLRGKLTKALLRLSDSCEATGQNSPLCALASKAVVETPMSLTFMEDTSRKLLELSGGEKGPSASFSRP